MYLSTNFIGNWNFRGLKRVAHPVSVFNNQCDLWPQPKLITSPKRTSPKMKKEKGGQCYQPKVMIKCDIFLFGCDGWSPGWARRVVTRRCTSRCSRCRKPSSRRCRRTCRHAFPSAVRPISTATAGRPVWICRSASPQSNAAASPPTPPSNTRRRCAPLVNGKSERRPPNAICWLFSATWPWTNAALTLKSRLLLPSNCRGFSKEIYSTPSVDGFRQLDLEVKGVLSEFPAGYPTPSVDCFWQLDLEPRRLWPWTTAALTLKSGVFLIDWIASGIICEINVFFNEVKSGFINWVLSCIFNSFKHREFHCWADLKVGYLGCKINADK